METGLSVERTWPVDARLLALAAQRAGTPGDWTGRACMTGGTVDPDDLASFVIRAGAVDVIYAGSLEDGETFDAADATTRQRMLDEIVMDSELVISGMEERSAMFQVDSKDLGDRWMVARFVHTRDCHTRQRRLHVHNLVILAGTMATVAV